MKKENHIEHEDFVCLNCRINQLIDDLLGEQDQFNDILEDNIIDYEMLSVVNTLEDTFKSLKRAKIELQIIHGCDVFRTPHGIEIIPPGEHLEH